jgi:hypothetical protein
MPCSVSASESRSPGGCELFSPPMRRERTRRMKLPTARRNVNDTPIAPVRSNCQRSDEVPGSMYCAWRVVGSVNKAATNALRQTCFKGGEIKMCEANEHRPDGNKPAPPLRTHRDVNFTRGTDRPQARGRSPVIGLPPRNVAIIRGHALAAPAR